MNEEFLGLKKEINLLPYKRNLVCFLLYGSIIFNRGSADDLDGIIVVKKVDSTLNDLFKLLASRYRKLDFNIYSHEEISKDLSFYAREFKLEYLAKGLCLYGKNIFKNEIKKVDKYKYRQSILIRSIEHLQLVRQKYFSTSINPKQKFTYLKKYFLRISKNILLFEGIYNHSSVDSISQNEIIQKLVKIGIFYTLPKIDEIKTLDEYFDLFKIISKALIECKKEFDSPRIFSASPVKKLHTKQV